MLEYEMTDLNTKQINAIRNAMKLDGLNAIDRDTLDDMIDIKNSADQQVVLFVDGASDLHSKTAGIGGVVYLNDQELACFSEPLFDKTNNEAEYLALIKGVKVVYKLKFTNVKIYADSELVVKQVLGIYKVKNERMKYLHAQVLSELQKTNEWSISHVRREKNTRADELSKIGLEKARSEK